MTSKRLAGCVLYIAASASAAVAADMPRTPPPPMMAQTADRLWETTFNSDIRYFTFTSRSAFPTPSTGANTGVRGSGSQFYIPMGLSIVGTPNPDYKIETTLRSGYVSSQQDTAGFRGRYTGTTDTVLSGTFTYFGFNGFAPYVSLNMNLPTGETKLFGARANALLDPDLVDVSVFGEGFNIGPTVGVNIPLTSAFNLNVSGGYTHKGDFVRATGFTDPVTGLFTTARISPADSVSAAANLGYQDGPVSASLGFAYVSFGSQRTNGLLLLRGGDSFSGDARVSYSFTDEFSATLSGNVTQQVNNFVADPVFGVLLLERPNVNSRLYRVGLDTNYKLTNQINLGPTASIMYRDRNAFIPQLLQFVPASVRYAVGGVAQYAASDDVTANVRLERIITHASAKPDQITDGLVAPLSGILPQNAQGWAVSAGVNIRF